MRVSTTSVLLYHIPQHDEQFLLLSYIKTAQREIDFPNCTDSVTFVTKK